MTEKLTAKEKICLINRFGGMPPGEIEQQYIVEAVRIWGDVADQILAILAAQTDEDALLTDEEISQTLDSRAATEHERFQMVAKAQLAKVLPIERARAAQTYKTWEEATLKTEKLIRDEAAQHEAEAVKEAYDEANVLLSTREEVDDAVALAREEEHWRWEAFLIKHMTRTSVDKKSKAVDGYYYYFSKDDADAFNVSIHAPAGGATRA